MNNKPIEQKISSREWLMVAAFMAISILLFNIFIADPVLESDDYPEKWPLSVDSVQLRCTLHGHPYVETPEGKMYALTGAGRKVEYLSPVSEILNADYPHVSWMIDMARKEVCPQ